MGHDSYCVWKCEIEYWAVMRKSVWKKGKENVQSSFEFCRGRKRYVWLNGECALFDKVISVACFTI